MHARKPCLQRTGFCNITIFPTTDAPAAICGGPNTGLRHAAKIKPSAATLDRVLQHYHLSKNRHTSSSVRYTQQRAGPRKPRLSQVKAPTRAPATASSTCRSMKKSYSGLQPSCMEGPTRAPATVHPLQKHEEEVLRLATFLHGRPC